MWSGASCTSKVQYLYHKKTHKKQTAKFLYAELSKRKQLFVSLELLHKEKRSYRTFPVYQQIHSHIFGFAFILCNFFV